MTTPPTLADPRRDVGQPGQGPFDAASKPWGYALLSIVLFFGAGGLFAYQAPLATSVIAVGRVVAEGERRAVQASETATIAEVRFSDGAPVEVGDVVIQLDTSDLDLRIASTLTLLRQAAAREARLLAERTGTPTIDWAHVSLQEETDPLVSSTQIAEQRLFDDRSERRVNQRQIIEQRIAQLNAQIEGEKLVLESLSDRQEIVASELEVSQRLLDSRLGTRPRLLLLQREEAEIRGEMGSTQARIAALRQSIGEADVQISELETAFLEEVSTAYPLAQGDRAALEDEFGRLLLARERRSLRASVAGRIIRMKHTGPGPVVAPGEVLFEIVPDQEGVLVEAAIRPSDIDSVQIGMDARVVFSALALQEDRSTMGIVNHISPDVFFDEASGRQFFEARISIAEEQVAEDMPNLALVIGMPTEVYILSSEQTLLQYLADPIRQVLDRGMRE